MNDIVLRAMVPTGTQALSTLTSRRIAFGTLVIANVALLTIWLAHILAADGFSVLDWFLLVAFIIEVPWTAIGFWNSLIGFTVIHGAGDPTAVTIPLASRSRADDPIFTRTAILMTLRNEDPTRAFRRLKAIKASVDATGEGDQFDYFVLSDSSRPEVIAAEEWEMELWRRQVPKPGRLMYRRRESNVGFKAGNVYEFCQRWGMAYEFMLPLDADSLMSGETILRLVRVMQANPRLGILQSLIVGTPSTSLFARLFQFGMRHGMRTYTAGSSWWQADCGPFWGHNAVVRIAPFLEHCRLPELGGKPPLGGHILSHDQIEGVMMRRGGYEVRLLPEEGGSFEDNPPTLHEFMSRNLRWCQGNLQYLKLLFMPGLHAASRFHLALALELFFSMAALVVFVTLAAFAAAAWPSDVAFPAASAITLYAVWMVMFLTPKLLGLADAFLTSARRYGGRLRLLVGGIAETIFTVLITPITTFAATVFMVGLLFGRKVVWDGQQRDGYRVSWEEAFAGLWPQTAFGVALLVFLAVTAPAALPWFLPFIAGLVLAVPFAVVTSSPAFSRFAARWKFCATPEEIEGSAEIAALRGTFARTR